MVTELREGIWRIDLGGVNAYLADDEGALTLVDAGLPNDAFEIASAIEELGYTVADVDRVLVTHYDLDHVGGLSDLGVDAPVYIGAGDARILAGEAKPPLRTHKGLIQRIAGLFTVPPPVTIRPVRDGDEVGSFTVYETPGHGPHHVAYVSERLSVAFLGDLVAESNGRLVPSDWKVSYDTDEVGEGIRSLAGRAPDFEVAAVGHGTPFGGGGSGRLAALAGSLRT